MYSRRLAIPDSLVRFTTLAIIACATALTLPSAARAEQFCGGGLCGERITPPATSMERPQRVYVMPVIWLPVDSEIPDTNYWNDYMGNIDHYFPRTVTNFTAHLRVAQAKYRWMLRNPQTGADRGTFALATWDGLAHTARVFNPDENILLPLVVRSPKRYDQLVPEFAHLPEEYPEDPSDDLKAQIDKANVRREMEVVAQVLGAAGCKIQSCPFVFAMVIAQNNGGGPLSGVPFNNGFNGGGGYARFSFDSVVNSNKEIIWAHSLQSTLLHELGHAFGLFHTNAAFPDPTPDAPPGPYKNYQLAPLHTVTKKVKEGNPPVEVERQVTEEWTCGSMYSDCAPVHQTYCNGMPELEKKYAFWCSPSVMAYTVSNQIHGCVAYDADGFCAMPSDETLVRNMNAGKPNRTEPALIPENIHHLSKNELVFPELAAEFDMLSDDCDSEILAVPGCSGDGVMQFHGSFNPPDPGHNGHFDIPGQPRVKASPTGAWASFGHHGKTIAPRYALYNANLMWKSGPVATQYSVPVTFEFPEPVNLARISVYTGYDNGRSAASGLMVTVGSTNTSCDQTAPTAYTPLTNGEGVQLCTAGEQNKYIVWFEAGWDREVVVRGIRLFDINGVELEGPREPIATSEDGTDQVILAGPAQVVVGGERIIESLGASFNKDTMWHSKFVGAGNWVWMDVRLPEFTNLRGIGAYTGHTGQYHPAGQVRVEVRDKDGTYVNRADSLTEPSDYVPLYGPTAATHLRVGFRAGPSGWIVVRGLRFFTEQGEVFARRTAPTPLVDIGVNVAHRTASFVSHVSSNETNVTFNFGDATPQFTGLTPTHTYSAAGTYHVTAKGRLFCDTGIPSWCDEGTINFDVVIAPDTIAPTIESMPERLFEADSPLGRRATYPLPYATDNVDGELTPDCAPASGSQFALGVTRVTCTARDSSTNASQTEFFVIVRDTTGPTIAPVASLDVPADSDTGAVVTYSLPATTDLADASVVATCFPGSGTVFPNGETTVTCGAEDDAGNDALPVNFTVRVLALPTLLGKSGPVSPLVTTQARYEFHLRTTSPGDITLNSWSCGTGTANTGGPSAQTDLLRLNWTFVILCRFPSTEATAVYMKFRAGNGVFREESVAVTPLADTVRPTITHVPADVVLTQTGVAGADYVLDTSEATATDNLDPSPTITFVREPNFDGSVYPIGTTIVTFTARDSSGNLSEPKTTAVTVRHNTEPGSSGPVNASSNTTVRFESITVPGFTTATAIVDPAEAGTLPGAFVSALFAYELSTTAGFDGLITSCFTVPQDVDADTFAALGILHRENGLFTDVTIRAPEQPAPDFETRTICASTESLSPFVIARRDTTAPTLAVDEVTVTGSDAAVPGAAATFSTISDDNQGVVSVECTRASGSTFAFGTTEVSCTAADAAGNTTTESFTVTVLDGVAPVVTVPADITREAAGPSGNAITFETSASDNVSGALAVTCTPASASLFEIRATPVTCRATDAAGNTGTASFNVTVADTVAPAVTYTGNAGNYRIDQNIDIRCAATDGGSGVAATTCANVAGPAYSFLLGANTYSATATDRSGNVGNATTTFTVGVSATTLQTLVSRFSTNAGVTNGLNAKLAAAAQAPNANARAGQLGAFENQVRAQTGKALTAEQAAILLRLAATLK